MADRDFLNTLINAAAVQRPAAERGPPATPAIGKLGVRERAREIGKEAAATPLGLPEKETGKAKAGPDAGGAGTASQAPTVAKPSAAPAFKAAYFNQDVATTSQVNLAARPQKALRGEEGATDLRRVVLPAPAASEAPSEPAALAGTLERMAPTEVGESALAGLVSRQGEWTERPSVKPETIAARQEKLERMVEDRKLALLRMQSLPLEARELSNTISHALQVDGAALSQPGADVEKNGNDLIEKAEEKATAMRTRLAKVVRSAI